MSKLGYLEDEEFLAFMEPKGNNHDIDDYDNDDDENNDDEEDEVEVEWEEESA
jgi:hypothetical protein